MRLHWSALVVLLVWAELFEDVTAFSLPSPFRKSPLATFSLRYRSGITPRMQSRALHLSNNDFDPKGNQILNDIDLELAEAPQHRQPLSDRQILAPNPSTPARISPPLTPTRSTPTFSADKQFNPLAPASDIVAQFLSWFDRAFPSTTGLRDVGRRLPQTGQDVELQFVGRESLLKDCSKLLEGRFTRRMDQNRKVHPIGVLGSGSGTGKTRASRELINLMTDFAHKHELPWVAPVLITYNDGQFPGTDRKLEDPELAFALRILYFAFRHDLGDLSFDDWVHRILDEFPRRLNPKHAVNIIRAVMDARSPVKSNTDKPGLVYISVDETNRLLDDHYEVTDKRYRALLKETMSALHGTMLGQTELFVLGMAAGITVAPLQLAFRESGAPYEFLRLQLLDWPAIMRIMNDLERQDARWKGWGSDTQFMQLLVDYAPIPGVAAELLQECRKQLQLGSQWRHLNYNELEKAAKWRIGLPSSDLALQLLEDAVLATPINRVDRVVDGLPWTYQELESTGAIVLSSDQEPIVQLIRPLFEYLLERAKSSTDPGMRLLKQAVGEIPSDPAKFTWKAFERFSARFEAAKEMIWAARKMRSDSPSTVVSVKEFYGSGAIRKSGTSATLQMFTSANVTIRQCRSRFPNTPKVLDQVTFEPLDWTSRVTTFVNADGAPFDTFRTRKAYHDTATEVPKPHLLLAAGQQKLYVKATVTLEDVVEEAKKTQEAVDDLRKHLPDDQRSLDHLLVIFATRADPELLNGTLPKDFPDKCLLLTGNALRTYFGTTLCDRAFVTLSQIRLNVNTANADALFTVPEIREATAKAIVQQRGQRPFSSWKELTERVPGIPASVEKHLSFDVQTLTTDE